MWRSAADGQAEQVAEATDVAACGLYLVQDAIFAQVLRRQAWFDAWMSKS